MASVHRTGSSYWNVSVKIWHADKLNPAVGKWVRTWRSTGIPATAPKEEAERVAEAIQAAAEAAAPNNPRRADQRVYVELVERIWRAAGLTPPPLSATWRDYSARFLAERTLNERTRANYAGQLKTFGRFLGKRADTILWNLEKDDFQKYYAQLIREGRSAKTADQHLTTLKSIMERAFLEGAIARNPVKLVTTTDAHAIERHPFTRQEISALLAFLDSPPPDFHMPTADPTEWKSAVLLGLCTGLRLQDAIGRAWSDFDLVAGTVALVPGKKARKGKLIKLPLAAPLASHLATLEKRDAWLTPKLRGKKNASTWFNEIVDAAGIDVATGGEKKGKGRSLRLKTFHSLRHTVNTWLAEAGAEKQIRMLISDHDDPRISDKYTHGTVQRLAEALQKVFPINGQTDFRVAN